MLVLVLPAATALLGYAVCALLLRQLATRPRMHILVWTIGLLLYAIAATTEVLGGIGGWTPGLYRAWYLSGAIGVAAYLGVGSVYLHRDEPGFRSLAVACVLLASAPALAGGYLGAGFLGLTSGAVLTLVLSTRPRLFSHAVLVLLLAATVAAAVIVLTSPVDLTLLPTSPGETVSGSAFPPATRALTPALNISGAALLIFGALSSAIFFSRTRAAPERVVSNILIVIGAFVPSFASGLTRFGITSLFFVGELIGMLCIVGGFLLSASRYRMSRDARRAEGTRVPGH
ncbi:MAG: hypothetical protein NVSMB2_04620 [Chloroflexota bacterium]